MMDVEPARAKKWYDHYGVTFPALVDPNFAFNLPVIPKTYLVDEHGVLKAVKVDKQFQAVKDFAAGFAGNAVEPAGVAPGARSTDAELDRLRAAQAADPAAPGPVVDLASRLVDRGLLEEARTLTDAWLARPEPPAKDPLLFQVYLQAIRCREDAAAKRELAAKAIALKPPYGQAKALRITYGTK